MPGDDINSLLNSVPGFASARIDCELPGGVTNRSFKVSMNCQSYWFRVDTEAVKTLGLDRRNEALLAPTLCAAGLTPRWIHSDLDKGLMIREFSSGQPWSLAEFHNSDQLSQLAAVLRRLHHLPVKGRVQDRLQPLEYWAERLAGGAAREQLSRGSQALNELAEFETAQAICHNDLVCENILHGDTVMLIDLEYIAVGDPYFDLATVLEHHQLPVEFNSQLLESYLLDEPNAEQFQRLKLWRRYYRSLLELWNSGVDDLA